MNLPQFVLNHATPQILFVKSFNTEQLIAFNMYIATLIKMMKTGRYTSFEELNEAVVNELLNVDDLYPN